MHSYNPVSNGNGSFQDQRLSALLSDDYVNVDERGLAELLLALRSYAENINFYDLNGRVNGNWLDLLLSNDSVLYASTSSINLTALSHSFQQDQSRGLGQACKNNLQHIQWINSWFIRATKVKASEGIDFSIKAREMVRHSLISAVTDLIKFNQYYNESGTFNSDDLDAVWGYEEESKSRDTLKIYRTLVQREARLSEIFKAILNVLSFLKKESARALQTSLQQQIHQPASGLILAFLQVYAGSQGKLNSFSNRLLDYYYTEIHKNLEKKGNGDRVFLECRLNPASDPIFITKGSQFSAGKTPELQDILYQTREDNVISGARLGALKTLFLQRHLLISPENLTQSVTAIKSSDVLGYFENDDRSQPHSVFGFDDGCSGFSIGSDSQIGLVISSRLLRLKQGQRRITLEFHINDRQLEEVSADNRIKKILTGFMSQQVNCDSDSLLELSQIFLKKFTRLIGSSENHEQLQQALLEAFKRYQLSILPDQEDQQEILAKLFHTTLITLLKNSVTDVTFFKIYHQLLSRHMFIEGFLDSSDIDDILFKANQLLESKKHYALALQRIQRELILESNSLFVHYFHNAFSLRMTTESGWTVVDRYSISHLTDEQGFMIALEIDKGMPSIIDYTPAIHAGNHRQTSPAFIININPDADIYPYSYLQVFSIKRLKLQVNVEGFKELIVQNDHGLVDRSKPFLPFGPIPVLGSCCYIGGYEYAQKNVSSLSINFQWKNLPNNYGGFSGYYEGYGETIHNSDFKAQLSLSSDGSWLPYQKNQQQCISLFDEHTDSGILINNRRIKVNLGGQYSTLDSTIDESQFIDMNQLNNGYLKLQLLTEYLVFGHKTYPAVMAKVLTHNSRNKKQIDLPEGPYTPEIASISVDYSAEEYISLKPPVTQYNRQTLQMTGNTTGDNSAQQDSNIYYTSAMGIEQVQETVASSGVTFFPEWKENGNLYIAYLKNDKITAFNLYFNLKNDSSEPASDVLQPIIWSYYSKSGWKTLLSSSILGDSTNGLMHSGIITFKLPTDIGTHSTLEPLNHYWIQASSSTGLENYSSIQQLKFDVISLQSVNSSDTVTQHGKAHSTKWRSLPEIPGIHSYHQHQMAYDNKNTENRHQAKLRLYERLRHKNRAITMWDYERLVLGAFPQVHMVKCFAATSSSQLEPAPGHVLIVVVPKVLTDDRPYSQGHLLNAVELKQISEYINELTPPAIKLEVRNPVYDRIQVRCAVKFTQALNSGHLVQQLNRAIVNYISPWSDQGYGVKFDWTIRRKDVESYILNLPYIADVSSFSIINIRAIENKPKKYYLEDSAAIRINPAHSTQEKEIFNDIFSAIPWSLAIPVEQHYIDVITHNSLVQDRKPEPVGINNLRIGKTFIINGTSVIKNGRDSDALA